MKKTLYKKDSKGKMRVLIISVEQGDLVQTSGLLDGKLVEHRKTCKPKNLGKANATTPEQQALSEMKAKVKDKLTTGYFDTVEEADNSTTVLPMLAKEYGKEKKKIKWDKGAFIQRKLDGMRCLAFISKNGTVKLMSREGRIIKTMMHIEKELSQIKEDIILDGELYAHGLSFQKNMSIIKDYQEGLSEKVKYNVYDIVEDRPFGGRIMSVRKYTKSPSVVEVETFPVFKVERLQELHESFVSEGYEGTIVRHGDDPYKSDVRSSCLLKYKDFFDIALPLADVIEGEQRPEWGVPVFYLDGQRFETGARMTHEERVDLLVNKHNYIGLTGEIRYPRFSDKGIPVQGVLVGFRLDK